MSWFNRERDTDGKRERKMMREKTLSKGHPCGDVRNQGPSRPAGRQTSKRDFERERERQRERRRGNERSVKKERVQSALDRKGPSERLSDVA